MRDILPEEIIWRKDKLGFNAPEDKWLSSHYTEMRRTLDGSKILRQIADTGKLKKNFHKLSKTLQWRTYNIAKWEEMYNIDIH
jgi:asparagine synthase (glutamine-hydrolysing)